MKNEPLISIVTPMYNAEKLIGETIESVLNQTYQNWEWIVVDNCSTDKSRDLITAINDSRIKVISLEKNSGGPAHPRNVGIENAKGEYVALLDADDIWHNEKLEALSKYYGEYEIIYHNEIHFYNKVEEGFKVNSVDVDKLKDKLTKSREGLEKWLQAEVGTTEPSLKIPGLFDGWLGKG